MKVLVTGGFGFIGYHTCEELLAQGHEVHVIDDLRSGSPKNVEDLGSRVSWSSVPVQTNLNHVLHAMRGCDAVIHLAADVSVGRSMCNPSHTSGNNLTGFIRIAELANEAKVKRVVYASSAAVYGEGDMIPLSPYGMDKLVNEKYANLFQKMWGLEFIGLRYFNVYGPRQDPKSSYAGVISKFMSLAVQGKALPVFGDGTQTRNFVYVGDVAKINVAAATGKLSVSKNGGVMGVGRPHGTVSLLQLIAEINSVVGNDSPIEFLPAVKGDIKHSSPNLFLLQSVYEDSGDMVGLYKGLWSLKNYLDKSAK